MSELSVVLCLLLALSPSCSVVPGDRSPSPTSGTSSAVVDRVVDGDTVVLRIRGTNEHARLIGIDTPETVKPNTPVECFGPEASKRLQTLLPRGTRVRVARDIEGRDRFGRLLVYLWRRPDEHFVNLDLIEAGYARTLVIAPNLAYRDQFGRSAALARSDRLGLWGSCPVDAGHR